MVNTLSGSVSAYRKEIVKPRFIRIDEVMALLDVTRDEAMDIALARIRICTGCIIPTFMRRLRNRRKKKQCCSDNR